MNKIILVASLPAAALLLLGAASIGGYVLPATQAEVAAGTVGNKYVSPLTLASAGLTGATNGLNGTQVTNVLNASTPFNPNNFSAGTWNFNGLCVKSGSLFQANNYFTLDGSSGTIYSKDFEGNGASLSNVVAVTAQTATNLTALVGDLNTLVLSGFGPNFQTVTNDHNGNFVAGPTINASGVNATYYWNSVTRSFTNNSTGYGIYYDSTTGLTWLTNATYPLTIDYSNSLGSGVSAEVGVAPYYDKYTGIWYQGDASTLYVGALSVYQTNTLMFLVGPGYNINSFVTLSGLGSNNLNGSFSGNLAGGTNLPQGALNSALGTNSFVDETNVLNANFIPNYTKKIHHLVSIYYSTAAIGQPVSSGAVYTLITNLSAYPNAVACGYDTIGVGDDWAAGTSLDANGLFVTNPIVWTNSMAGLTSMAHTQGLQIIIATSSGSRSSDNSMPGSDLDHIYRHMFQFASWGYDGVWIDNWAGSPVSVDFNATYFRKYARTLCQALNDINSNIHYGSSIKEMRIEMVNQSATDFAGEIAYALPELQPISSKMLCVGLQGAGASPFGFDATVDSFRVALNFRAAVTPGHVLADVDISSMSPSTYPSDTNIISLCTMTLTSTDGGIRNFNLDCFTNTEVYNIMNDPAWNCGNQTWSNNLTEVWAGNLSGIDAHKVVLINHNNTSSNIVLAASMFGGYSNVVYNIRDPWLHTNRFAPLIGGQIISVPGYGIPLLTVTPATGLDGFTKLLGDAATNSAAGLQDGTTAIAGGRLWVIENGTWVKK